MNVKYEKQGDYLIPCVRTKEQKEIHFGVWANCHRQYLKQSHKVRYYNLLTSEKLYDYLADIEEQAENMFLQLVDELAEKENVTEALKAENAMEWVQKMNNIRNRAMKDVVDLQDITYKDTESYINILYKKNTRKWICRLKLTDTVKTLIVPDEEKKGQKFNLTSVYDLEQYNDLLHKTLARYM